MKTILTIKNKKGMEFKSTLFSLVVLSMLVVGIGLWINEWDVDYGSGITYDLNEYDKSSELSAIAQEQKGSVNIKSTSTTDDTSSFEGTSIKGVFGIINNIFSSFNIVLDKNGLLGSIINRFNIPTYIWLGVVTLIMFAIVFGIAKTLFRVRKV